MPRAFVVLGQGPHPPWPRGLHTFRADPVDEECVAGLGSDSGARALGEAHTESVGALG